MTRPDRQDALAQGGRRRLRDLQQSRAPQRGVARDVGRRRPRSSTTSATIRTVRVVVRHRRRRQGLRVRRRHLEVRGASAPTRRRSQHYNATVGKANRRVARVPEADHRDDPRLLHRRRPGLALCCDLRIASDEFASSPCRRPSSASATPIPALKRLVDVVGPSFAKEIFYTARQFDRSRGATPWGWSTASCRRTSSRATSRTMPTRSPATRR